MTEAADLQQLVNAAKRALTDGTLCRERACVNQAQWAILIRREGKDGFVAVCGDCLQKVRPKTPGHKMRVVDTEGTSRMMGAVTDN